MSDPIVTFLYRLIVNLHIAAGVVALASFWIAGFARKARGGLHVRSGTVYLYAMRVILVTAVPMALMAFAKGYPATGAFLLYLVALVAASVNTAPRAVRYKQDFAGFRSGSYRFHAYALPLIALATFAIGIATQVPLLLGFSLVGIAGGVQMQYTLRRATAEAGWWLKEHYSAMLGNGVGTHIAFFSIGLTRLAPQGYAGTVQTLAWFGPLAIVIIARRVLDRRHRRRFSAQARATSPASISAAG